MMFLIGYPASQVDCLRLVSSKVVVADADAEVVPGTNQTSAMTRTKIQKRAKCKYVESCRRPYLLKACINPTLR